MPAFQTTSVVGTLHFDLSHSPLDVEHTLNLAGKTYKLAAHTAQTRADHAANNAVLAAVPADQQHRISHFAENVTLPDNVAMMWVQHPSQDEKAPLPALSAFALHIPRQARPLLKSTSPSALAVHKLAMLGAAPPSAPTQSDLSDDHAHSFKTPLDTAITLVSMHPELMHLDPAVAGHIHDNHLVAARGITDLAIALRRQGPAETDRGWATISPCVDETGKIQTHDDIRSATATRAADSAAHAHASAGPPASRPVAAAAAVRPYAAMRSVRSSWRRRRATGTTVSSAQPTAIPASVMPASEWPAAWRVPANRNTSPKERGRAQRPRGGPADPADPPADVRQELDKAQHAHEQGGDSRDGDDREVQARVARRRGQERDGLCRAQQPGGADQVAPPEPLVRGAAPPPSSRSRTARPRRSRRGSRGPARASRRRCRTPPAAPDGCAPPPRPRRPRWPRRAATRAERR